MIYLLLAFISSLIVAVFSLQNAASVTFNFFYLSVETSLAIIIIASALCGFLAAFSVALYKYIGLRIQLVKANQKIKEQNLQIENLQKCKSVGSEGACDRGTLPPSSFD